MKIFHTHRRPVAFPECHSEQERIFRAKSLIPTFKQAFDFDEVAFLGFAPSAQTNVLYKALKGDEKFFVKFSQYDPDSISREYENISRLYQECPMHFTRPKGCVRIANGVAMTIEWIDGASLAEYNGQCDADTIVAQLSEITDLFMRLGFVHYDLHIGSIMISNDGRIVPIDFQISFFLSEVPRINWLKRCSSAYRMRCRHCDIGVFNDRRTLLHSLRKIPNLHHCASAAWTRSIADFDRRVPLSFGQKIFLICSFPRIWLSAQKSKKGSAKQNRAKERLAAMRTFFGFSTCPPLYTPQDIADILNEAFGSDDLHFWKQADYKKNNYLYRGHLKCGADKTPVFVKYSAYNPQTIRNEYENLRFWHQRIPRHIPRPISLVQNCRCGGSAVAVEWIDGHLFGEGSGKEDIENQLEQISFITEEFRQHGFVHRDFCPGNIMVTSNNVVKVFDMQDSFFTADTNGIIHWKASNAGAVYRMRSECCAIGIYNDRQQFYQSCSLSESCRMILQKIGWLNDMSAYGIKIPLNISQKIFLCAALPLLLLRSILLKRNNRKYEKIKTKIRLTLDYFSLK